MESGEHHGDESRAITYCVIPADLAAKLHDPLRRHFAEDPFVDVVVERRGGERRITTERRRAGEAATDAVDLRRIRNAGGRRIADRRAPQLEVVSPVALPRRARLHARRLVFIERVAPTHKQAEDVDTARLVTRFQAGDERAFSEIYIRYFDRIYAYLRVLVRQDPHEAEDLTQQVFTKIFQALPRYEHRNRPFRAWMFVIARNEGLLHLGRRSRIEPADPEALGRRRDEAVEDASDLSALEWISDRELVMFVERLPPLQRQTLAARYMLGLTVSETAEALGKSASHVRQLESRALRFLQARLTAVGRSPREARRPLQGRSKISWLPVLRARRFSLVP